MATLAVRDIEQELVEDILSFRADPVSFVRYSYPWGEGELSKSAGPRKWQSNILNTIGDHLKSSDRHQPLRIAVSSGHGIGKSALVAMVIDWAISTCKDTKIIVTANTGTQLSTKTVPETAKWFRSSINAHWWEVNATSVKVRGLHDTSGKIWRCDFIPWSDSNTEAFAGLHNEGKRIVLIFDEASAIMDKLWEVAEGAMTDENTEIIWLAFGNPTQNTGRFRECFGRFKHRWKTFQIDSRKVEGTNKEQIDKWVQDYGEDSDFVRVRVRGEFPRAGSSQFIDSESIARCRSHKAEGFELFPRVLGVDVARFGDDQTVIFLRQGRKATCLAKYRGKDTAQVTAHVIDFMNEYSVDATVVDSDGIGNTVYDQLKFQGFGKRLFEFHGGKPANNSTAYFNRRAEVWGLLRDALKATMEIPDEPELEADLTGPQYGFSAQQQVQLERKEDMKKRGLSSPDMGDALAMTFAVQLPMNKPKPKPEYTYPGERSGAWMG